MTRGQARIQRDIIHDAALDRFLDKHEFDAVDHMTDEEAREYLYCSYVLGEIELADMYEDDRAYCQKRDKEEGRK